MLESEDDVESIVAERDGGGGLFVGSGGGASITPTGSVAFLTGSGGFAGVEGVVEAVEGVACSTWTIGCGLTGRGGAGRRVAVGLKSIGCGLAPLGIDGGVEPRLAGSDEKV